MTAESKAERPENVKTLAASHIRAVPTMSISQMSPAHDALRQYVQRPSTRASLVAYVRRRGLYDDADDVVQTVLCDALAVEAVPPDPSDLPRWITGIARNKVADEQRRRAKWKHAELPELGVSPVPEVTDLLRRVDAHLVGPEERRSLALLLREHAGDALHEIAREHAMRPATLRQRLCRLRRQLRTAYGWPLLLALLAGGGVVAHRTRHVDSPALTSASVGRYEGEWRVVDAAPYRDAASTLTIVVRGMGARVEDAAGLVERDLTITVDAPDRVTLQSGPNVWRAVVEARGRDRLRLTTPRGFVVIERVR